MNAELVLLSTCSLLALSVLTIPLLPVRFKSATALVIIILNAIATSVPALQVLWGGDFRIVIDGGFTFGNILFEIDPISSWFILIINITLINGALYGSGYMKAYISRKNDLSLHWIMFVLFHLSMLWVCMLKNSFAFLVAWEIMTLSSFVLVLFDHDKANTLQAGINYLIQMHLGVALLIIAFVWVFIAEGNADFQSITSFLKANNGYWVILLFFLGFGIKAGFVPLHTWLPYAHPAAPSHVSGVMSGIIVKMGIYGILRIALSIGNNMLIVGVILVIFSAITAIYGILNASVHRDFKKMLAFCTSENIGIIGIGIGMALIGEGSGNQMLVILGLSAALIHTLNHSLYKSLLFFTSGNIYLRTHTRNMELLGGLIRYMPHTAILFLLGSLAIGGLPPLNGFISKYLIYYGFIESFKSHDMALSALMITCTALLSMAGGVSMLTFTKAFGIIFLGEPRSEYSHMPTEANFSMRLPLYIIIIIMLIIGLFPVVLIYPVNVILNSLNVQSDLLSNIAVNLKYIGLCSLGLLGLTGILLLLRNRAIKNKTSDITPTWGCGYNSFKPSLQYTGKSFSKSLAKLFGFITIENKKYKELKTVSIFPSARTYTSYYLEFFETRVFDPLIKQFLRVFNLFSFIHNGKIQFYVLYGLIFIVVLIILSVAGVLR